MNSFMDTLRNLGPARLLAIGAVGLALIGFFIFIMTRFSTSTMELLYSELSQSDAAAIAQQLEQANVPFEVDATGTQIRVPADQVVRMRMQMAQAGLPQGGSIGYEIFDRDQGFGATSFVQDMNRLRALEGEMARTVGTLQPIKSARVHLVLPRRELFSRARNTATASVFVALRPGAQLSQEQILSIQHLIASSVPNLEPNRVAVIDQRGRLLARGQGDDNESVMMQTAEERKVSYERRMTRVIEDLLGQTLGYGKVRAEVTAELDFDRITTNAELFDPDQQVVRSTQTVTEESTSQERDPLEPITVNNNLPVAEAGDGGGAFGPLSSTNAARSEETINYEISRTTRTHVRETGRIRRLSIAVLVDGDYAAPAEDGAQPVYSPRSEDEIEQIERLVRSAVGFDAQRGDVLEVVNMRFAPIDDVLAEAEDLIFGLPKDDVFRIAEMVILGIVAVLIILLVVRPLITRAFERPTDQEDDVDRLLTDQANLPAALAAPSGALAEDLALEAAQADEELEQMIDINRVEGRVRASSLRKVGEIVDKHPEEAVSILRNWLYQES